MEIITLPWNEEAPKESDCIHVEEKADGTFLLDTSALGNCADARRRSRRRSSAASLIPATTRRKRRG